MRGEISASQIINPRAPSGINKGTSDPIETLQMHNRRRDNLRLFLQEMACLLGSVTEEYYNDIVYFRSSLYPVAQTT